MILIKPILTEKSLRNKKNNSYVFVTDIKYNKYQIKKEIIKMFGFSIKKIGTMIYPKKKKSKLTKKGFLYGKISRFKKIVIHFKDHQNILFKKGIKKNNNVSKKIKTDNTRTKV